MKDFRVEPVRGDDLAKLLLPAAGIAAFALLAGQWLASYLEPEVGKLQDEKCVYVTAAWGVGYNRYWI